jgi:hypothetical protein
MRWWVVLLVVLALGLFLATVTQPGRNKCSVVLNRNHQWEDLWARATRLKRATQVPVDFVLSGTRIHDKLVHSKVDFEALMRLSAKWGAAMSEIVLPPYRIDWRDGPTMEYVNDTVYVAPEALGTFTDADIVLASVHELVGHHYQENAFPGNASEQKEACSMTCEQLLSTLSPVLVDRWILMRLVRALIDLRVNHTEALRDKPTPREIYDHFGIHKMTFHAIVDLVTRYPGFTLSYVDDTVDVGKGCGCGGPKK